MHERSRSRTFVFEKSELDIRVADFNREQHDLPLVAQRAEPIQDLASDDRL